MGTTLTFDIVARDRASAQFDKFGRAVDGSSDKMKRFAAVGAAALGAGAVLAAKSLFGMTQAAIADQKSQASLANALKNSAGATDAQVMATEDWITAQGKALGVTDDDLRPALARLALATGDVGEAQRLASLAMDVSAGTGKSLTTVTEALQKAQNGSLGGLSRLGVATKNADGSTKSLAQVTRELAALHSGQASAAADTAEGKLARLKLRYDETKESIGAKLIPVLTSGADKLLTFVDQMEQGEGAGGKLAAVFTTIGDNLDTLGPAVGAVVVGLTAYKVASIAAAAAAAVQAAGTTAATGATWSLNAALRANPIGLVVTALTLLGAGLVIAYKKSETFRNVVDGAFAGVKSAASTMGSAVDVVMTGMKKGFEAVGRAGTWLWNNALQPAFKFIVSGIASILDLWASMLRTLGKVPGFGWAKDAADAMANAASKAQAIADNIKKIPPKKTVEIFVNTISTHQAIDNATSGQGGAGKAGDGARMSFTPRAAGPGAYVTPGGGGARESRLEALLAEIREEIKKGNREQLKEGSELRLTGGGRGAGQGAHMRGAW